MQYVGFIELFHTLIGRCHHNELNVEIDTLKIPENSWTIEEVLLTLNDIKNSLADDAAINPCQSGRVILKYFAITLCLLFQTK